MSYDTHSNRLSTTEIAARDQLYQRLQPQRSRVGAYNSSAKSLVHRGRRGFFRANSAYILSALANGGYDDQERPDGALYHFPQSHQHSLDAIDIAAAENCQRDHIPIFYVQRIAVGPARYRIFYPAHISSIDNEHRIIDISFVRASQV